MTSGIQARTIWASRLAFPSSDRTSPSTFS